MKAWHGLHPRVIGRGRWAEHGGAPPIVRGTAIRIEVEHLPKRTSGTKKTLWPFWSGAGEPDLDRCWRAYLRRFDIEHTFRFIKNTMGWTTPSLCTPDQADRWTWLMIAAYTRLRLARPLVDDLRLPWERRIDPGKLTPARVRRGFGDFVQRSAPQPVHRNRPRPVRDDRRAPENRPEPAIPQSKRLLELGQGFNRKLKSCIDAESDCATRLGGPTAWGTPSAPPPRPRTGTRTTACGPHAPPPCMMLHRQQEQVPRTRPINPIFDTFGRARSAGQAPAPYARGAPTSVSMVAGPDTRVSSNRASHRAGRCVAVARRRTGVSPGSMY